MLLIVKKWSGGFTQIRTGDTRIFNPLLYQLSYEAIPDACCEWRENIHAMRRLWQLKTALKIKKVARLSATHWSLRILNEIF